MHCKECGVLIGSTSMKFTDDHCVLHEALLQDSIFDHTDE